MKYKLVNVALLSFFGSVLIGCSTPYKSAGFMGGYSDMALNEDTYNVSFKGNGLTSLQKVQNYALRRSAELTISKGYKYFVILDGGSSVGSQIVQTPTTVQTHSYSNYQGNMYGSTSYYGNRGYGNYNYNGIGSSNSYTTINPGSEVQIDRYTSNIIIKMLKTNKYNPQAFDASVILSNYQR